MQCTCRARPQANPHPPPLTPSGAATDPTNAQHRTGFVALLALEDGAPRYAYAHDRWRQVVDMTVLLHVEFSPISRVVVTGYMDGEWRLEPFEPVGVDDNRTITVTSDPGRPGVFCAMFHADDGTPQWGWSVRGRQPGDVMEVSFLRPMSTRASSVGVLAGTLSLTGAPPTFMARHLEYFPAWDDASAQSPARGMYFFGVDMDNGRFNWASLVRCGGDCAPSDAEPSFQEHDDQTGAVGSAAYVTAFFDAGGGLNMTRAPPSFEAVDYVTNPQWVRPAQGAAARGMRSMVATIDLVTGVVQWLNTITEGDAALVGGRAGSPHTMIATSPFTGNVFVAGTFSSETFRFGVRERSAAVSSGGAAVEDWSLTVRNPRREARHASVWLAEMDWSGRPIGVQVVQAAPDYVSGAATASFLSGVALMPSVMSPMALLVGVLSQPVEVRVGGAAPLASRAFLDGGIFTFAAGFHFTGWEPDCDFTAWGAYGPCDELCGGRSWRHRRALVATGHDVALCAPVAEEKACVEVADSPQCRVGRIVWVDAMHDADAAALEPPHAGEDDVDDEGGGEGGGEGSADVDGEGGDDIDDEGEGEGAAADVDVEASIGADGEQSSGGGGGASVLAPAAHAVGGMEVSCAAANLYSESIVVGGHARGASVTLGRGAAAVRGHVPSLNVSALRGLQPAFERVGVAAVVSQADASPMRVQFLVAYAGRDALNGSVDVTAVTTVAPLGFDDDNGIDAARRREAQVFAEGSTNETRVVVVVAGSFTGDALSVGRDGDEAIVLENPQSGNSTGFVAALRAEDSAPLWAMSTSTLAALVLSKPNDAGVLAFGGSFRGACVTVATQLVARGGRDFGGAYAKSAALPQSAAPGDDAAAFNGTDPAQRAAAFVAAVGPRTGVPRWVHVARGDRDDAVTSIAVGNGAGGEPRGSRARVFAAGTFRSAQFSWAGEGLPEGLAAVASRAADDGVAAGSPSNGLSPVGFVAAMSARTGVARWMVTCLSLGACSVRDVDATDAMVVAVGGYTRAAALSVLHAQQGGPALRRLFLPTPVGLLGGYGANSDLWVAAWVASTGEPLWRQVAGQLSTDWASAVSLSRHAPVVLLSGAAGRDLYFQNEEAVAAAARGPNGEPLAVDPLVANLKGLGGFTAQLNASGGAFHWWHSHSMLVLPVVSRFDAVLVAFTAPAAVQVSVDLGELYVPDADPGVRLAFDGVGVLPLSTAPLIWSNRNSSVVAPQVWRGGTPAEAPVTFVGGVDIGPMCPPGTTNNLAATAPRCAPCPVGWANNDTDSLCKRCPKGASADVPGLRLCASCPSGTFFNDSKPASVPPCDPCPVATFNGALGAMRCSECPADSTTLRPGRRFARECWCAAGWWSLPMEGAEPHRGCFACAPRAACTGGGRCAEEDGYTGPFCAECVGGSHHRVEYDASCRECHPLAYLLVLLVVACAVPGCALLLMWAKHMATGHADLQRTALLGVIWHAWSQFAMVGTMRLGWPEPVAGVLAAVARLALLNAELLFPSCFAYAGAAFRWFLSAQLPLCTVVVAWPLVLYQARRYAKDDPVYAHLSLTLTQFLFYHVRMGARVIVLTGHVMWPGLVRQALQPFHCAVQHEQSRVSVVDGYPSQICWEGAPWHVMAAFGAGTLVVVGLGVPLLSVCIPARRVCCRAGALGDKHVFAFLWLRHKARYWWWGALEYAHRGCFALLVGLATDATAARNCAVLFAVNGAFEALRWCVRPGRCFACEAVDDCGCRAVLDDQAAVGGAFVQLALLLGLLTSLGGVGPAAAALMAFVVCVALLLWCVAVAWNVAAFRIWRAPERLRDMLFSHYVRQCGTDFDRWLDALRLMTYNRTLRPTKAFHAAVLANTKDGHVLYLRGVDPRLRGAVAGPSTLADAEAAFQEEQIALENELRGPARGRVRLAPLHAQRGGAAAGAAVSVPLGTPPRLRGGANRVAPLTPVTPSGVELVAQKASPRGVGAARGPLVRPGEAATSPLRNGQPSVQPFGRHGNEFSKLFLGNTPLGDPGVLDAVLREWEATEMRVLPLPVPLVPGGGLRRPSAASSHDAASPLSAGTRDSHALSSDGDHDSEGEDEDEGGHAAAGAHGGAAHGSLSLTPGSTTFSVRSTEPLRLRLLSGATLRVNGALMRVVRSRLLPGDATTIVVETDTRVPQPRKRKRGAAPVNSGVTTAGFAARRGVDHQGMEWQAFAVAAFDHRLRPRRWRARLHELLWEVVLLPNEQVFAAKRPPRPPPPVTFYDAASRT